MARKTITGASALTPYVRLDSAGLRRLQEDSLGKDTSGSSARVIDTLRGLMWAGVYQKVGRVPAFRLCGLQRTFHVEANDALMSRLDGILEFMGGRGARPAIYVQLGADTLPAEPGDTSPVRGRIAVRSIGSARGLGSECRSDHPFQPPPLDAAKIDAAIRDALGKDYGKVIAGSMRMAPVWLNRDARGDALVLIRSPGFCEVSGCTLLEFEGLPDHSYRLLGRTIGVMAPVGLMTRATNGYQNIGVTVHLGTHGDVLMVLSKRGSMYPTRAALEPTARTDSLVLIFRP